MIVCELHLCLCSQVCHWQGVQQPHQVVRVCYVRCVDASYHNVAIWTNTCELTRWQQEMKESWTMQNLPKCLSSQWTTFRCAMPLAVEVWDLLPAIRPSPNQQKKEAQHRMIQTRLWIHSRTHPNPTTTKCVSGITWQRTSKYWFLNFRWLYSMTTKFLQDFKATWFSNKVR